MLTPDRLQEIKARCERATPGPWFSEWENVCDADGWIGEFLREDDADFAAHAREDVPALVAEVERWWAFGRELRNEIRRWRYAAEEMQGVAQAHRGNWCDVAFPEGKAEGLLEAASIVEEMLNKLEARQHAQ